MSSRGYHKTREKIVKNEGIILSTDTLNLEQLTITARDFIVNNEIEEGYDLVRDINVLFGKNKNFMEEMYPLYYRGRLKDTFTEDEMERMEFIWHEEVYNFFNNMCPDGYYFGCTDGDGACIGFFRDNEDWED